MHSMMLTARIQDRRNAIMKLLSGFVKLLLLTIAASHVIGIIILSSFYIHFLFYRLVTINVRKLYF